MCPASAVMYVLLILSPLNGRLDKSVDFCSQATCEQAKQFLIRKSASARAEGSQVNRPENLACLPK